MTDTPVPPCGNCGQPIGKLENTFPWANTRVCWDCHKKLTDQQVAFDIKRTYPPETPVYGLLKFVSDAMWYLGLFVLFVGAPICLLCLLGTFMLAKLDYSPIWLALLGNCVLWGFVATVNAEILYAIRDIARNSWLKK